MSDLAITAANVVKGANARIDRNGFAGETITAGQAVVKNSSGYWVKADSNHATAALSRCWWLGFTRRRSIEARSS